MSQLALTAFTVALGALTALATGPLIEALKLRVTRRSWAAQELWKLKVSLYERLLVTLDRLNDLLEPDPTSSPPYYADLSEAGQKTMSEALRELDSASSIAALWLPPDTAKALRGIRFAVSYSDPSCQLEDTHDAVIKAKKLLLDTVKTDLRL
jgi:hypothetical protein